ARTSVDGKRGIIVEVNCETDFVAKNEDFIAFSEEVAKVAIEEHPSSIEGLKALAIDNKSIADLIIEQTSKIGEKVDVSSYEFVEAEKVVAYIHSNYRLGVLVGLNADVEGVEEAGRDV